MLPSLVPCMHQVLVNNEFESEAKLLAITAFGDLSLAAGAINFYSYLEQTKTAFFEAAQMSLNKGNNPEEIDLFERLRVAIIDAYISILHGLYPEENQTAISQQTEKMIEEFAHQMFQYLEELVAHKELNFPGELLKPMYELYLDISTMYVNKVNNQDTTYGGGNFLPQAIIHSALTADLRQGLVALPPEDRMAIESQFIDNENTINLLKSRVAIPAPRQLPQMPSNSAWAM